jgi:DNA repair protein RecO (recombination protein O)
VVVMVASGAIVLGRFALPGGRTVTRVFSREAGRVALVVPRVLGGRVLGGLSRSLQPVDVEWEDAGTGRGELRRVVALSASREVEGIYGDAVKSAVALLWGEVLGVVTREGGRDEGLFDFLSRSVDFLNGAERGGVGNFNLFFLFRLCGVLGFKVDVNSYREGFVFDARDGGFHAPGGGDEGWRGAGVEGSRVIRVLCGGELEEALGLRLNGTARGVLLDVLLLFLGFQLGVSLETRGVRVVRSLFDGC